MFAEIRPTRVFIAHVLLVLCATGYGQTPALPDGTADERRAVLAGIASRLEKSYVLADVAGQMAEFLRTQAREGAYANINELKSFAEQLTTDLRAISHDGHMRVNYHADPAQVMPAWSTPAPEAEARHRRYGERTNFGFARVEILPGNVGYIRLDEFGDPARGGDVAAAAMRFVSRTGALIIDLRANGGGNGGMVSVLATYLLGDEPTHLSDFHIRERNETFQSWTAPFVPGPRYVGKPVFVLTGPETASAAESFAYDLQALQRVQVVGKKTAGAANPGGFVRVSEHLAVFIPDGRPVNPITGTNWEGVGVQPEVDVDVEAALGHAHRLALEQLLANAGTDPEETQIRREALTSLRTSLTGARP